MYIYGTEGGEAPTQHGPTFALHGLHRAPVYGTQGGRDGLFIRTNRVDEITIHWCN